MDDLFYVKDQTLSKSEGRELYLLQAIHRVLASHPPSSSYHMVTATIGAVRLFLVTAWLARYRKFPFFETSLSLFNRLGNAVSNQMLIAGWTIAAHAMRLRADASARAHDSLTECRCIRFVESFAIER